MDKDKSMMIKRTLTILFVIIYFLSLLYVTFSAGRTTYLGGLYQKSCGEFASTENGEIKIISNKDIMCSITNPLILIGDLFIEISSWFPILFIFGAIIFITLLYFIGSLIFKLILKIPSRILIIVITTLILIFPIIVIISITIQNPCKNFQGAELSYCLEGAYATYDNYYMQIALYNFYQVDPKYVISQGRGKIAYDALDNIGKACDNIVFDERKNHCYEYRDSFSNKINDVQ